MSLTEYNKFVKKHRLAGLSMKQIGKMWREKKGGKSKKKSKPKSKPKPKKDVKKTTKPKSKKRPRGQHERAMDKKKKEIYDLAYALGVPKSKVKFNVSKKVSIVTIGNLIRVKRRKLSDAIKEAKRLTKKRL